MTISLNAARAAFPEFDLPDQVPRSGTFKTVFATTYDGRPAALKISNDTQSLDEADEADPRSLREIEIMASADHPGLIRILRQPESRVVAGDSRLWYVEEYCPGGCLADIIPSRHGAGLCIKVLTDVLPALDYLWTSKQVVHRDVKPLNIGVKADGSFVLLDLGIALAVRLDKLTQTALIAPYTPAYAAPEQGSPRSQTSIDVRTDLFSLGVVAYECLTGEHPFTLPPANMLDDNKEDIARRRQTMLSLTDQVALVSLIERCLEFRQSRRPRNATAALAQLRKVS